MNAPANIIKRGRKFDQVLKGAREVFLQDGFEGASVDDIARAAGVSKATLYSYFPDKRLLFMEVATLECRTQADSALAELDLSLPPEQVLWSAGQRIANVLLSDFGRNVFRICVAENERFPELGQEFYRNGPMVVRRMLAEYFEKSITRNELQIEDIPLAADQFAELCKANLFPRMIMGVEKTFSADEIDRVIKGAVEMFLARYGTRG